jgi:ADP-heptose:LPS heptosyltransferase
MSAFAIKGGIGDFLQSLPFMMDNLQHEYLVASHHDRVREFFAAVGINVEEMLLGRLVGVPICPRKLFLGSNPFPKGKLLFTGKQPVIGIHLGASSFSLNVERRFGFPPKALPITVLEKLLAFGPHYNFILFGSPAELDAFAVDWSKFENLKVAPNADITLSLPHVSECDALIGSDSAFKTMSAMLHIPTIVWVGDYQDTDRDDKFITPYVRAGVIKTFRYTDLTSMVAVSEGVDFCLRRLSEVERSLCGVE